MRLSACRVCKTRFDPAEQSDVCPGCGAPVSSEEEDNRERRQVTVLFADIVNYTSLALHLDTEDLSALLQNYYTAARSAIEAHGGVVAEYLADGIVAHFGVPIAHQDTVDRALSAAEILIHKVNQLQPNGRPLAVRVGVATGVVLAEFEGGVSRVTGASSVLAARLQAVAEANTIYVSELTRRLSRRTQGFQFRGNRKLKGFEDPVPVWAFDPSDARAESDRSFPFVGRELELRQLMALWKTVVETGRASPLRIVSGPPGIGKSRLVRELCSRAEGGTGAIVFQAAELHRNTSLFPVIEWLRQHSCDTSPANGNRYFRALLQADAAAELLASEAPAAIRQGTFDALVDHFRHISQAGPRQLILEDLQWMDQSSLELVMRLIDGLQDAPIQWLATCRPELNNRLSAIGGAIMSIAELSELDCRTAAANFCGLVAAPHLPDIVAKCEGVPIFLEHLLRALKDGRFSTQDGVPEMLVGELTAWIDRTGSARRTARYASVSGRNITPSLLAQIAGRSEREMEQDVDRLCEAQVLRRDGDSRISFRHDLLRDAAYDTLLRSKREALHRKVAEALHRENPVPNDKVVAELAFHYEAARDYPLAAESRHRLGKYATATGAFAEAESQLLRAAELLSRSHSDENRRQRANVLVSLAANYMQTRGFTDPRVMEVYMESLTLLKGIESTDLDSLAVYWGIFTHQVLIGQIAGARDTVERMAMLLHSVPEEARLAEHILSVLGTRNAIEFYSGKFLAQLKTLDQIRARYRFDRDASLATRYGMDIFATAQAFAPHSAAITGQFALMRELVAEADSHQVLLSIPLMVPFVDIWCGVALSYVEDFVEARRRIERGIEQADRQGAAFWSATGRMWLAIVEFDQHGGPECRTRIEQALALQKLVGVGIGVPYWTAKLAEAYARDGHDDRATQLVESALADHASEGTWLAERQRICGFVHECGGRVDRAFEYYNLAARTAESQHATLWEARARYAAHRLTADQANVDRLQVLLSEMRKDPSQGGVPASLDAAIAAHLPKALDPRS